MKNVIAILFFICSLCMSFGAHADDSAEAMQAAQQIQTLIAENRHKTVWDSHVSKFFKDRINEQVFLANLSQGRVAVGGARLSSRVVDINYSNQDPASGYKGDIYLCRFLNKYPRGEFYDSIVLIKESDGKFRLSGIHSAPASQ